MPDNRPSQTDDEERDIQECIHSLSPKSRAMMIGLLGELFNVLDNLESVCEPTWPACRQFRQFHKLRRLLAALNEPCEAPRGDRPSGSFPQGGS